MKNKHELINIVAFIIVPIAVSISMLVYSFVAWG